MSFENNSLNKDSSPEQTAGKRDFGKHPPIAAERIFDWTAYGLWNYGIQTGTSVLAGMWFRDGGGKKYFDKSAQWLGDNVVSKLSSKRGFEAARVVHTPLVFGALIMVGNFFIPPIQYAERRKEKCVSWINDKLNAWRTARGNAPSESELKVQQEAIAAIAEEPHQTSASLWGGRALGLGANIGASLLVGEDRNLWMQEAVADGVSKSLRGVGATNLAQNEKVRNFSRIALLDYGYSIISANVIYFYSHFINPPKTNKPDAKQEESSNISTVSQPTNTEKVVDSPSTELAEAHRVERLKHIHEKEPDHAAQLAI